MLTYLKYTRWELIQVIVFALAAIGTIVAWIFDRDNALVYAVAVLWFLNYESVRTDRLERYVRQLNGHTRNYTDNKGRFLS